MQVLNLIFFHPEKNVLFTWRPAFVVVGALVRNSGLYSTNLLRQTIL